MNTEKSSSLKEEKWISIEDALPMMDAMDYFSGGTLIEVEQANGSISYSKVMDHNIWYYVMKDEGVTHWRPITETN